MKAIFLAAAMVSLSIAAWGAEKPKPTAVDLAWDDCKANIGPGARYRPGYEDCAKVKTLWIEQHADELAAKAAARAADKLQRESEAQERKTTIENVVRNR